MKYSLVILFFAFCFSSCQKDIITFPTSDCYWADYSANHPKNQDYMNLLDGAVKDGLPGINLLIDRGGEEIWIGAAGVSRIENQQDLEPCNIMPLGGVSKLYCAAACILMVEDGLLKMDETIDNYLPVNLIERIPNSSTATIAHLLDHSSGIPDYSDKISVMLDMLNHKDMDYGRETMLEEYVYNKPPEFKPGEEYSYSNSNYEILTIIMDNVYPDGHHAFYSYRLFRRLGLRKTYYKEDTTNISMYKKGMANGYFDRHSDGILENATDLSLTIVTGQTGSDGIYSNVVDLHTFLCSILESSLIRRESLQTYKHNLGLVYKDFGNYGMAIGHSGILPGFTTEAWYFIDYDTYIVYQVNAGKFLSGQIQEQIDNDLIENLLEVVFGDY